MLARVDLRGSTDVRRALARPPVGAEDVEGAVAAIIADVRSGGDAAVRALSSRFNGWSGDIAVSPGEPAAALERLDPELRAALEFARDQIVAWHEVQRGEAPEHLRSGVRVREVVVPVDRVGCYVPGGRAPLASSVLMTALPARVAGVGHVALCTPPRADGTVHDAILAAAAIAGVDAIYRVGGAQAIAAFAYGTETIAAVDVIVGPGTAYTAEAKRQVATVVAIDSYAGPSEVAVVADATVAPVLVAADMLAQAEHGPGGSATIITWDEDFASAVEDELRNLLGAEGTDAEGWLRAGGRVVLVEGPEQAMAAANAIAPEHLELMCAGAEDPRAARAQCGCGVRGRRRVGGDRRLRRGRESRAAHWRHRALHRRAASRRLPQARARRVPRARRARGAGAVRHNPGRRRGTLGSRRGDPVAGEVVTRAREARAQPRDDLRSLDGYHSPQVDVRIRLNTNESPYAPPAAFVARYTDALRDVAWHRYPDRGARELRHALGSSLGQPVARLLCANGSNEILQTLLLTYGGAGRRAVIFEPTYALHAHIAEITNTEIVTGERRPDFTVDVDAAIALVGSTRPSLVFLCSPNNPTGTVEPRETIERLLAVAADIGALLIVDEAYGEFAPWSALELVDEEQPLVVVRTYSKVWSLAAVRLGFAVAPTWVIDELDKVLLPYALSVPTQLAGTIALDFHTEMEKRVAALVEERGRIFAALSEMPGLSVVPSGANFLLVRVSGDAHDLWRRLLERGVLVRDFSSRPGVEGCFRITVGSPDENDEFLAAITAALPEVVT